MNLRLDSTLQCVLLAIRKLRKEPGFASAVLLTLVLGIGATTAVFSVVSGVLLQPLPHPHPEQLVLVREVDQRPGFYDDTNLVSAANFVDWRQLNRAFEAMAAYQTLPLTFRGEGDPERVPAALVGTDFFEILRVQAALGRTFLPEENQPGKNQVVMLSHDFWRSRFDGDPDILGRSVRVGSSTYPVVGVLPAGFTFLDQEYGLWAPLGWSEGQTQNRRAHIVHVLARLRDGVSLDQAQLDMDTVVDRLRSEHPEFLTGWGVRVQSLTDEVLGDVRPSLLLLLGAAGFVLLTAAVNVANLVLARSAAEGREVAVRSALGAGRARLVLVKLLEAGVLALAASGLAVGVAMAATRLLVAAAPAGLPHAEHIALSPRVLAFSLAISFVAWLFFGSVGALQAVRSDASGESPWHLLASQRVLFSGGP